VLSKGGTTDGEKEVSFRGEKLPVIGKKKEGPWKGSGLNSGRKGE